MIAVFILRWQEFNPRSDVKRTQWFRLNNDILTRMFEFSNIQKLVWIALLSEASTKQSAQIVISEKLISALLLCSDDDVIDALKAFEHAGMIELNALRGRNADVTRTLRGRTATEQNRTEQNRVESNGIKESSESSGRKEKTEVETFTGGVRQPKRPRIMPARIDQLPADRPAKKKRVATPKAPTEGSRVWDAYADAYRARYNVAPTRNAKANALCSQLVKRVGVDDAILLVRFYLTHSKRWYVEKVHMLDCVVGDAEALLTQMRANVRLSSQAANQLDLNQHNRQVIAAAIKATGWKDDDDGDN